MLASGLQLLRLVHHLNMEDCVCAITPHERLPSSASACTELYLSLSWTVLANHYCCLNEQEQQTNAHGALADINMLRSCNSFCSQMSCSPALQHCTPRVGMLSFVIQATALQLVCLLPLRGGSPVLHHYRWSSGQASHSAAQTHSLEHYACRCTTARRRPHETQAAVR